MLLSKRYSTHYIYTIIVIAKNRIEQIFSDCRKRKYK